MALSEKIKKSILTYIILSLSILNLGIQIL